jgi:uncharacterized membrane protein
MSPLQQHNAYHVQPPSLQQQQQQVPGVSSPGSAEFDAQVGAVRQLVGLQQEAAELKMTVARLRQQADEDEAR